MSLLTRTRSRQMQTRPATHATTVAPSSRGDALCQGSATHHTSACACCDLGPFRFRRCKTFPSSSHTVAEQPEPTPCRSPVWPGALFAFLVDRRLLRPWEAVLLLADGSFHT
eukprot:278398-Rhodomonas_salina.1